MTDAQKLQQLFDAALKAPTDFPSGPPKRAAPPTPAPTEPAATAYLASTPKPHAEIFKPLSHEADPVMQTDTSTPAAHLDKAAAYALGALLDDQVRRQARKRRRAALVTATVLLGVTGGGFAWFVQSAERFEAFTSAIRELRSVGDVNSMVAKYQQALDRISARGKQIDHATTVMGVKPNTGDGLDPHMDAEMKEMIGGEGATIGQRNSALQKTFGEKTTEHDAPLKATRALNEAASFE